MPPRPIAWFCAVLALALALIPFGPGGRAAAPSGEQWQVVLVAGDYAEPVFDNATRAVKRLLSRHHIPDANIHRLSARPGDPSIEPATASRLLRRIAGLPVQPGGRCLVFITSHGQRGKGIWLAHSGEVLRPEALAQALAGGCGAVPTIVIVSGCYAGSFATRPMTARNRIILPAARADRSSFGCQVDRTYTVFDQCLLEALPLAPTWRAAFGDIHACVRRRERELSAVPSLPQASFGAAVRNLPIRF